MGGDKPGLTALDLCPNRCLLPLWAESLSQGCLAAQPCEAACPLLAGLAEGVGRTDSTVFLLALKQRKQIPGRHIFLPADLSPVPCQREGPPLSEPDLLEGTVALRGGTLSILSLCQSEGCCRQEAHVCGLWLAVSFCFHGY